MAKHANPTFFHKKKFLIIFLFVFLLILLFIFRNQIINLFYKSDAVATDTNENSIIVLDNSQNNGSSEKSKKTVVGADYLEISAFTLDCSSSTSEVTASIKNNSSESHNSLNLSITFLDEKNDIVTTLSCPIKSIEPNETKHTYGIVDLNLSNCTDYEVKLLDK